jgi:hypothetical protein
MSSNSVDIIKIGDKVVVRNILDQSFEVTSAMSNCDFYNLIGVKNGRLLYNVAKTDLSLCKMYPTPTQGSNCPVTAIWLPSEYPIKEELPIIQKPSRPCTCGAHKAYGPDSENHSYWCDTYEFYKEKANKQAEANKNVK